MLCVTILISAQVKVAGVITDANGYEMPFTDVYVPNSDYYTSSNSDGSFYIELDDSVTQLYFYQVGYDELIFEIKNKTNYDLKIVLQEEQNEKLLNTVEATNYVKYKNKRENPAYQILREIWKRKKSNGLKRSSNYTYDEYEKIEFDLNNLDSTFIQNKIFKGIEFVFDNIDTSYVTGKNYLPIFLNESVYRVVGQNRPDTEFKRILKANKTSGFEENEIVAQTVKNLYKDFNIYENRLNFFDKAFISPVAQDGFAHYEYTIIDTLQENNLNIIKIKYFPKRANELTFKGTFEVVDSIFSISNVTLQSTKGINVNFVRDIFADLSYQNINDSVFVPERSYIMLDMSLVTKKDKEKGMYAHKTNSYKNFEFDIDPSSIKKQLSQKINYVDPEVFHKSQEYWKENRHIPLSGDETDIYRTLDTLKTVKKIKQAVSYTRIFATGYVNILKTFQLGNIYSTVGYNPIEGVRLRTGGRTYLSKNDMWRIGGFLAYGFKDQKFKFGGEFRHMFNPNNRFSIGMGYKKDIEQLGAQLTTDQGIMTRSFASSGIFSRGDIGTLSWQHKANVFTEIEPFRNIRFRLDFTYQNIRSANPDFKINYLNFEGIEKSNIINSAYTFSIIAKPNARYSRYGIDRYEHSSNTPLIVAKYTRAYRGAFNSDFNYNKIELLYRHPILWGSLGVSEVLLQGGKLFGRAPLSLLSVVPGNQSYSIVPGTYSQLNYYEFVTDTYLSFQMDHHFNGRFFSYVPLLKKLNLREVAFFRSIWGEISDNNREINRSSIEYRAPDDEMYYEYGFGIENIGFGNLRMLRVDFNWRGNYRKLPDASNFGVKFGFNFSF